MDDHFAHSLPPPHPLDDWEPLPVHLRQVAEGIAEAGFLGAAGFAAAFGARDWGAVVGYWHDLGKYSEAFQRRLHDLCDPHGDEVAERVDHSTAGAQIAVSKGLAGRLAAYCIAGHHAGLPDFEGGGAGLAQRLKKSVEPYDAAPRELIDLPLPALPRLKMPESTKGKAFTIGFFIRMLFSCLVDADFLATERFMSPKRAADRPGEHATLTQLLASLEGHLARLRARSPDTPVNRKREEVRTSCRAAAALPPGLFSLAVPTGGGKTFSSLVFALAHAAAHELRRVVYAVPFTSIIEQTADNFRAALGDLSDHLLEHHSSIDPEDPGRLSTRTRLAAENWDAPLVATTNVQLLESLFDSRTSRCRKLHRLARSVIILDEAQALPPELLAPSLAALNELVRNYGSTVLLCTATQPAIERRGGFPIGLAAPVQIIEDHQALYAALRRTDVQLAGTLCDEELVDRLARERQVLCIVNSRRHAASLFGLISARRGTDECLHLSASMCGAHRAAVIVEIRRRLSAGFPCRVISTQVIEAGVDVDFPAVFRAAAGLDSIAQAAGRCNREGTLPVGRVTVFDYDTRQYASVPLIEQAANHFREIAPEHSRDLLAPAAVEAYFRLHYWATGGEDGKGWDRGRGEGRPSVMECFGGSDSNVLYHQFRTAAQRYRLIDDAQVPVLAPWGRGAQLRRELEELGTQPDSMRLRSWDRRAQRFIVGVTETTLRKLRENQVLGERFERYYLLRDEAYDENIGISAEVVGLDPEILAGV